MFTAPGYTLAVAEATVVATTGADSPHGPSVVTGQPVHEEQQEEERTRGHPTHTLTELVLLEQTTISELAIACSSCHKEDAARDLARRRY